MNSSSLLWKFVLHHAPPSLLWLVLALSSWLHLLLTSWVPTSVSWHPHGWLWVPFHPLTCSSCDQQAGTSAVKELKLSSSASILRCSSPTFAELILHTCSAPDRYARQDSNQLTHFRAANRPGVLFSETSSHARERSRRARRKETAQRVGARCLVLLLLRTSGEEMRKLSSGFPNWKCANSWGWRRSCPLPTHTIVFSILISLGQLNFWLSPVLSHSGINSNQYENLPPW